LKLRAFERLVWNRRWVVLGVLVLAVCLSPLLKRFVQPTYTATAEITYVGNGADAVILPADLPELAMSYNVLSRASSTGHLGLEPDKLLTKLTVRETPHSDIIPITYKSKNPSLTLNAANSIADATVAEYKLLATRQYDEVIDQLQSQLTDLRFQIRDFNARYQDSVTNDPMVGVTAGLDSLAARLETADQTRAAARAKLDQDIAAAALLEKSSAAKELGQVVKEETLAHDPAVSALRDAQSKDLADYESMKAGYTDQFPALAGLREKVERETRATERQSQASAVQHRGASPTYAQLLLARQAAASLVAGDRAQVAELDRDYAQTRARLNDLPRLTAPADDLRVQRDGATAAYLQVEQRLRTAMADKAVAGSLNSIVVLDHATSALPNIPPLVAAIVLVVLFVVLAIGAAYLAEMLDPRVRTRIDVESLYGSPLIGSV
jgi:uncharacterized protein involved in exopolysaccharide biosynthesis